MTLFLDDGDVRLYHGDALETVRQLPDDSVDCVVTSPPYWGLRDYGTGEWEYPSVDCPDCTTRDEQLRCKTCLGTGEISGGDPNCDHVSGLYRGDGGRRISDGKEFSNATRTAQYRETCGKCGARRVDRQMGLEPTPDLFVHNMVELFREIRRVLAPHGTCWVNLGDSYASSGVDGVQNAYLTGRAGGDARAPAKKTLDARAGRAPTAPGFKPKDLVGIPWRVAFALQADGWWLRSDIIWAKPNPMPESVTDRPTKSHEYIFLLTKQPRYWFDTEAVREQNGAWSEKALEGRWQRRERMQAPERNDSGDAAGANYAQMVNPAGRNVRSVWQIATQPYPEAHFATYPEELARRCILAGCPTRVCRVCGKPSERIVERGESDYARLGKQNGADFGRNDSQPGNMGQTRTAHGTVPSLKAASVETVGWSDCGHNNWRPGVTLDPFIGSGTTAKVARDHQRHAIGIDLNHEYLELAARRLQQLSLLNAT